MSTLADTRHTRALISAEAIADLQESLRELLEAWFATGREFWKLTAVIGERLATASSQIPTEDWAAFLEPLGLTPWLAFIFMRASRVDELMEKHKPSNLREVAKLLPQGDGTAFDAEQAVAARELADAGMSRTRIAETMFVSPRTVLRWTQPVEYAKQRERRLVRQRSRDDARKAERDRRRAAALRARGGLPALAANHIQAAITALDEAFRSEDIDREKREAFGAALDAIYRAQDKIYSVEGIR